MTWAHPQLMAWIQRIEAKAARATLFELLELAPSADGAAITAAFHRIAGGAHPDLHRHVLTPAESERLVSAYGKIAAAYDTLRDPRTRDRYRKELTDRGKPMVMPPVIGGSQAIPVQRPVTAAAALAGRTGGTTLPPGLGVVESRTKTPSSPRITVPPAPAQDPTGTTPATSVPRASSPSRAATDTRTPLITPPPPMASAPATARPSPPEPPRTTTPSRVPPTTTAAPRGKIESRPPQGGVAPRAQAYFRKAQACLGQGDLGGALFNLRLAAAADPASAMIRVALAEVEAEIHGAK